MEERTSVGNKIAEMVVNFILRAVLGTIAIYFINEFLSWQQINILIGINPLTILTSGILGFPGIAALYGINLYMLL